MLTIRPISSGAGYHFYLEKESTGEWVGTGAEILGLPEQVSADDFRAIRLGVHPETGEQLRIRKVVDRIYDKPWGPQVYKARELYDLTISAPKSASVLGLVDPQIAVAHAKAVESTWREMEQRCGAMVIAAYQHGTSRKLDPQIHTHLVAGNLAISEPGRWRTLHANELYRGQAEITRHYREQMLGILEQQGYRIKYPEIAGIPKELLEKYSQRSEERNAAIREHLADKNLDINQLTNKEIAVLIRRFRDGKDAVGIAEGRERQLARLTPAEHTQLLSLKEAALERQSVAERPDTFSPRIPTADGSEQPSESPKSKLKLSLDDHTDFEAGLKEQHWNYGEAPTYKSGSRMRVG